MATTDDSGLLAVEGLNAWYGRAQVLHDVGFTMGTESVAVIGRNGMGKTSLCLALMGLMPRATGSVRFAGTELMGKHPYQIANAGLGFVPQGRRLFPSLTVDEHFRMLKQRGGKAQWTIKRVYDLFPRLAERKGISGTQLSGGEQQMLAISRALLTNPRLLIMDEPSEGLAPTIVDDLVDTCKTLVDEGMSVLVVEQNLGAATTLAERLLVMVAGEIFTETTATAVNEDPTLQQRYLGVTAVEAAS
jgi:branched-chain amino acid transport system ATP-binding protein